MPFFVQLNLPERNEDASFSGNKHFLVKCCKSEDPQAPSIGWTVVLVVPSQIFIQKNSSMFYNILLSSLELY